SRSTLPSTTNGAKRKSPLSRNPSGICFGRRCPRTVTARFPRLISARWSGPLQASHSARLVQVFSEHNSNRGGIHATTSFSEGRWGPHRCGHDERFSAERFRAEENQLQVRHLHWRNRRAVATRQL